MHVVYNNTEWKHPLRDEAGPQNIKMTIKDVKVNGGIDDAAFEIK